MPQFQVLLVVLVMTTMTINALISLQEQQFICAYNGVAGFPVPCSDAANACRYTGPIKCRSATLPNDTTTNEVIIELNILFTEKTRIKPEIAFLQYMTRLNFSASNFTGSTIPTELALCSSLTYVAFRNTGLVGTVPREFFASSPGRSLVFVDLSNNRLSGTLPGDLRHHTRLIVFRVQNNAFHGTLPLFNASSIYHIDVSANQLSGTIPAALINDGRTAAAFVLNAQSNRLSGTIPSTLFSRFLSLLDLSNNLLEGTIPSEVVNSRLFLQQLSLNHNRLSGTLPETLNEPFVNLFRLNLAHNRLSGRIPVLAFQRVGVISLQTLTVFRGFIHITLNDNDFSGPVPVLNNGTFAAPTSINLANNRLTLDEASFGDAVNISWLDFSGNQVNGTLPATLFANTSRFTSLISLDLSYSRISGTLPSLFRAQYLKLNNNFFEGRVSPLFIHPVAATRLPVFADVSLNRLDSDASRGTTFGGSSNTFEQNTEVILADYPQDVDECALATHECESLCLDGWFPVPGYTCGCESGYVLDVVAKRNCTAVCGDGILRYPEEACDFVFSKYGCGVDCRPLRGYKCGASGCVAICGDGILVEPEQCDTPHIGCTANCTVAPNYTCSTLDNTCRLCASDADWRPVLYAPNTRLFPRFTALGHVIDERFKFSSCLLCSGGISLETRTVLESVDCLGLKSTNAVPCSFACPNLTVFSSAHESLYTLQEQLSKGDFLAHIIATLFPAFSLTSISILSDMPLPASLASSSAVDSLSSHLAVSFGPCTASVINDNTSHAIARIIHALALDIAPNTPHLRVAEETEVCRIHLLSTDDSIVALLSPGGIAGLVIAALVIILLFGGSLFSLYHYSQSELHALPSEISWSFFDRLTHPWRWCRYGAGKGVYYARVYAPQSEEFARVHAMLVGRFKSPANNSLKPIEITAIYNEALSVSFVNQWKIARARKRESPEQFYKCTYRKNAAKMAVMHYFETEILSHTEYNERLDVPLIGALHGTDYSVATKIAATGFAALSSLDAGYFGKGIYFTTHLLYTLPYCCMKRDPAVILSYINMGNIYPVTECHKSAHSLMGAPIKSGYTSHLVVTNKDGTVYDVAKNQKDVDASSAEEGGGGGIRCDEIVVGQESQILPAFIIRLDDQACRKEFSNWDREVAPVTTTTTASLTTTGFDAEVLDMTNTTTTTATTITSMNDDDEYYVLLQ